MNQFPNIAQVSSGLRKAALMGFLMIGFAISVFCQTVYFEYSPTIAETGLRGSFNVSVILRKGKTETLLSTNAVGGGVAEIDLNKYDAKEVIFRIDNFSAPDYNRAKLSLSKRTLSVPGLNASEVHSPELYQRGKSDFVFDIQGVATEAAFTFSKLALDLGDKKNKIPIRIGGADYFSIRYKIIPKSQVASYNPVVKPKPIDEQNVKANAEIKRINEETARKAEEARKAQEKAEAEAKVKAQNSKNPEDIAWASAVSTNTSEGYKNFLLYYPSSSHKTEAYHFIKTLENKDRDDKLWSEVKNAKTPQAYERYLKTYPNGMHAGEAKDRMSHLGTEMKGKDPDEEEWKILDKSGFAELKGYLTDFPYGKHRAEAEVALKQTDILYASPDSVRKKEGGIVYKIIFKEVWGNLVPESEGGTIIANRSNKNEGTAEIELLVPCESGSAVKLTIQDELGRTTRSPIEIRCGQKKFTALVIEKNKDGNMILDIMGGFPPYTVQFRQNGKVVKDFTKPDNTFSIDLSEIEADIYEVVVLDSKKTYETEPIQFEKKNETAWVKYFGAFAAFLAIFGIWGWKRNKDKQSRQRFIHRISAKNR